MKRGRNKTKHSHTMRTVFQRRYDQRRKISVLKREAKELEQKLTAIARDRLLNAIEWLNDNQVDFALHQATQAVKLLEAAREV